jgi:hypothetical protein
VWEPQRVPDLLQTGNYARALADVVPGFTNDKSRQDAAEALAARQQVILEERRTEMTVIIAETALRQPVGSLGVMRAQLARLADDSDHVTIHLLPSDRGAQAVSVGPLTIMRFIDAPGLGVVYLPGPQGGTFLEEPADLATCARAFEQLKTHALAPDTSARRLRELAAR